MSAPDDRQDHDALRAGLRRVAQELDLVAPPAREPTRVADRRRAGASREDARRGVMRVVERDGVLLVEEGRVRAGFGRLRRRAVLARAPGATVVDEVPFERLRRSDIRSVLDKADRWLTPNLGLRRLAGQALVPVQAPRADGRVLLLVHGTFSNCDNLLGELRATPEGTELLARAAARYDEVLTFDHRTLGVSPVLNAHELARHFAASRAHVDVVCHSRGGLVVRWWLEGFDNAPPERRRAVFVGAPLAGTSLASPHAIGSGLSLLANIGRALGAVAGAPFLGVLTPVFTIVSSVTWLASRPLLADAAIALVPGLQSMSRVADNLELAALRGRVTAPGGRYFVVRSNFEPDRPGWRFWRWFRDLPERVKDSAMDAVFPGPNDLVVDTASMAAFTDAAAIPDDQVLDFGTSTTVHHTNYFRQPRTVERIRAWLGIG